MCTYTLDDLRLKIGKLDECIEIINSWFPKDEQENDTDTLKENMENIKNYFHCVRYLIEDHNRYRERLQFDPGGSDKIDELESAIELLRFDLEGWKRTVVDLTHEKYQALCDVDKLKEFVQLVKECSENATHLMPIAADALLIQPLHTESKED